MFTQKYALTEVFVLILLLVLVFNVQSYTQQLANKPKDLFEMSIEELMDVKVIVVSAQPAVGVNIQKTNGVTDFFEMSLEELMEIEIIS